MIEANIYKALGDPIRLEMVRRLAGGSPLNISELSKNLGVSRQGARKQLQVLVSANVVRLKPQGRGTLVNLDTATLKMAQQFISRLESEWKTRLEALKNFVEN